MKKIMHVVRRYGPVGGMERYVWELTRNLSALGAEVVVVCEKIMGDVAPKIEIHELGEIAPKPRWLSLLRFSGRVSELLEKYPEKNMIVHSHERLALHHVTTFHGPPFATVFEKPWWKRISLRVYMQLWLEKRELCGPQVRVVVPNSPLIGQMLGSYYPCARLVEPIEPGVDIPESRKSEANVPEDGGVIGFVGKEYKRKGLEKALEIAARLRRKRPKLTMLIVGPEEDEISFKLPDFCRCLGWSGQSRFPNMDVLLHPAKSEPYGMVVSEALAFGVPVVISSQCGIASSLKPDSGAVLDLNDDVDWWAEACEKELARKSIPSAIGKSWQSVAEDYLKLYRSLL